MNSIADVWGNVLKLLQKDLSETTIATWFDELEPVDIQGNLFLFHCANDFKKRYIESLFMKNIKTALRGVFSIEFDVVILGEDAYLTYQNTPDFLGDRFTSASFTFETFVVGSSNKLAYAASRAVAEHPAQNYNPLLIYGDSGLGKTHLIYAIANEIRKTDKECKIVYVKGDDMTNELVDAIRIGSTPELRDKYRQADLLLIDDVQFIAGRKQTQEEFFHTFNTLYESGRQIVLTSDRPPSEISQLEDRLRTRFEWGLLVDVTPPDFETRLAIVKNKAALMGISLPDKIATIIARKVTANVRQLEGTMNKILAYRQLLEDDADIETAERAMQDILKHNNEYIPTPEEILNYISRYYKISPEIIRGQQRLRKATAARQIAMYIIRTMTSLSLEDIGKFFDNRDHSTVLYSVQQVEKKMKADRAYAEVIKEMKSNISESY